MLAFQHFISLLNMLCCQPYKVTGACNAAKPKVSFCLIGCSIQYIYEYIFLELNVSTICGVCPRYTTCAALTKTDRVNKAPLHKTYQETSLTGEDNKTIETIEEFIENIKRLLTWQLQYICHLLQEGEFGGYNLPWFQNVAFCLYWCICLRLLT